MLGGNCMLQTSSLLFSIECSKPNASFSLSNGISDLINQLYSMKREVVVLCIGTDRSTGDCLGPLVGHKLASFSTSRYAHVFGTLKEPVHAKNLDEKIDNIYKDMDNPFIIAIDASLGRTENVGKINLYKGPLHPGAGVNKNLKSIGDISITGIVNISGFMEYLVLQNTRLSLVMEMADIISISIYNSLKFVLSQRELV
jgi:putative sporulation protein YyaC